MCVTSTKRGASRSARHQQHGALSRQAMQGLKRVRPRLASHLQQHHVLQPKIQGHVTHQGCMLSLSALSASS